MIKKKLKLKKKVFYLLLVFMSFFLLFLLFYATYFIYMKSQKVGYYQKNNTNYSFLIISEMSDAFAEVGQKEFHFVKDLESHVYIVAISKDEKKKYQGIIDYTYGKSNHKEQIKVYGYPILENEQIHRLIIKYINKFLPYEEHLDISEENYSNYFFNTYLDTTIQKMDQFNIIVFLLFLLFILFFYLFIKILWIEKRKIYDGKKRKDQGFFSEKR